MKKNCVLIWAWQMMSWTHGYSHRYPSNWSRLDIFNLSLQKIWVFKSFTSSVFYLDDVLNNISFHVTEQDNQTCFLSWVHILPHAQTIYSAWLVLKQRWVCTMLFLGRIHLDMPEMVLSQLVTQWSLQNSDCATAISPGLQGLETPSHHQPQWSSAEGPCWQLSR